MPLKRRAPKPRMVTITPRAIELYLAMERLERGCDEWYDRHSELHKELALPPWIYPLDVHGVDILDALQEAAEVAAARRRSETAPAGS